MEDGINELDFVIVRADNGRIGELSGVIVLVHHIVDDVLDGSEGLHHFLMREAHILLDALFHRLSILLEYNSAGEVFTITAKLILLLGVFDAFDLQEGLMPHMKSFLEKLGNAVILNGILFEHELLLPIGYGEAIFTLLYDA